MSALPRLHAEVSPALPRRMALPGVLLYLKPEQEISLWPALPAREVGSSIALMGKGFLRFVLNSAQSLRGMHSPGDGTKPYSRIALGNGGSPPDSESSDFQKSPLWNNSPVLRPRRYTPSATDWRQIQSCACSRIPAVTSGLGRSAMASGRTGFHAGSEIPALLLTTAKKINFRVLTDFMFRHSPGT